MMHVVEITRPVGQRLPGEYVATRDGAELCRGQFPIARAARTLLAAGIARPGDEILAIRKAAPTRRGEVVELAQRLDA